MFVLVFIFMGVIPSLSLLFMAYIVGRGGFR